MTNLDSMLKSRDITLPTKVHLVKAMGLPIVMYGCESWTIKKAELQRIDAFELWCWRRLLRVPWTARRSNQSILKEISPAYSLEGLMLKLKLQSFGHLMGRTDSLEKARCWERLKVGGEGDDIGWGGWMASLPQWTWLWVSKLWELVMDREAWRAAVHVVARSWTRLSNSTELMGITSDIGTTLSSHFLFPSSLWSTEVRSHFSITRKPWEWPNIEKYARRLLTAWSLG